jgi:hypothetical protein
MGLFLEAELEGLARFLECLGSSVAGTGTPLGGVVLALGGFGWSLAGLALPPTAGRDGGVMVVPAGSVAR